MLQGLVIGHIVGKLTAKSKISEENNKNLNNTVMFILEIMAYMKIKKAKTNYGLIFVLYRINLTCSKIIIIINFFPLTMPLRSESPSG